jgi:hypothetical protein
MPSYWRLTATKVFGEDGMGSRRNRDRGKIVRATMVGARIVEATLVKTKIVRAAKRNG